MVSNSYKWTPREMAGCADKTVYILLEKEFRDEVSVHDLEVVDIHKSVTTHL